MSVYYVNNEQVNHNAKSIFDNQMTIKLTTLVWPQMGELSPARPRDPLGRNDLHAGRRPPGRHQTVTHRQWMPFVDR